MSFLFLSLMASAAASTESLHSCRVEAVVQIYDLQTGAYKSALSAQTDWFDVTLEPHEDAKDLQLKSGAEILGSARVWTGTLLATKDEGDVLQAHATFEIDLNRISTTPVSQKAPIKNQLMSGTSSLVMSLDSRLARTQVVLDGKTETDFVFIPVNLKCSKK